MALSVAMGVSVGSVEASAAMLEAVERSGLRIGGLAVQSSNGQDRRARAMTRWLVQLQDAVKQLQWQEMQRSLGLLRQDTSYRQLFSRKSGLLSQSDLLRQAMQSYPAFIEGDAQPEQQRFGFALLNLPPPASM